MDGIYGILHAKVRLDTNIHCNLLLYSCCTIFITNWIRTKIFKLLRILLSSTGIAYVFVMSSTELLIKQLLVKNACIPFLRAELRFDQMGFVNSLHCPVMQVKRIPPFHKRDQVLSNEVVSGHAEKRNVFKQSRDIFIRFVAVRLVIRNMIGDHSATSHCVSRSLPADISKKRHTYIYY